jgi:phosphoglycerate dehydrogenase-like enzyme
MSQRLVMLPPSDELTADWAKAVAKAAPGLEVVVAPDRQSALRLLPQAAAAFGTLDPELLACAAQLTWLQAPMAAPPAGFFFDELIQHPVQVTNFRGIYNDHVAIHAVAMLLALSRNLHTYMRQQPSGQWSRHLDDSDILHLPESTVLVVGVGGIGAEITRQVHAFGARVVGVDPRRTDCPEAMQSLHGPDELDRLLGEADAVILTLPHTPQSEGLMDARRLALMRPHAFLINIGRGATVQLDALAQVLGKGLIAGAALDVFEIEPLPPEHALWREPRALLTPHVAVVGPYIPERRLQVLCENARRFEAGLPLQNVVDKVLWY